MKLFSITETVQPGIRVIREEGIEPNIAVPEGCAFDLHLHPKIIAVITEETDPIGTVYRLERASIDFTSTLMLLKPEVQDQGREALAHVGTAGGVGGLAYLTDDLLVKVEEHGRINRCPDKFPPLGIQAFCMAEALNKARSGVEVLDVLLHMKPGSSFCIRRTGELEGAQPVLAVSWSGSELKIRSPYKKPYVRATPAAAGLEAEA
jgi:hypothetical protein